MNTGLNGGKTASKKGRWIFSADAVTMSNNNKIVKQKPFKEIIILLEKRDEILNKLRKVLQKWNSIKCLNY